MEGGVIGQAQDHGGTVRARTGKVFVHDTQDVQLVGIAHRMANAGHPFRQARGQGKAVVQAHGGEHQLADGGIFVLQAPLAFEDAHAPLAVIAGFPVAEGMPAQVLFEAGNVMVQGRQQAGAVQRRGNPPPATMARAWASTCMVWCSLRSMGEGSPPSRRHSFSRSRAA
mgnify:CR=1 FL=1